MGLFLRKSFRAGPVRFNISKSGIGMSTGVKGLRLGTGPRGAYVAGGRGALRFRQSLPTATTTTRSRAGSLQSTLSNPASQTAQQIKTGELPPNPTGLVLTAFGLVVGLILLAVNTVAAVGVLVFSAFGIVLGVYKSNRFTRYDNLLRRLSATADRTLLSQLQETVVPAQLWAARRRFFYRTLFESTLADGISAEEKGWLAEVAATLQIDNVRELHAESLKPILWGFFADHELDEAEEKLTRHLLEACELTSADLPDEFHAIDQLLRCRQINSGALPVVEAPLKLQRGESCHHTTKGAFLEKKVLRSYTEGGVRKKEEGLAPIKEGDIYITSKRILLVGDGMTSIPHEKVLEVEVDVDEALVTIVKDGRQKPLYVKVPDAIFTGTLMEHLATRPSSED
jgi:hypothetical protein